MGQLQYRYFTLDSNSNISAVTTNEFISTSLHIPNIQKSYISQLPWVSSPTNQQIIDAKIVGLTWVDKKNTEVVDALTDRIQKTCGRLDWKTKRGDVLYDPVTKEVVSRGKRTKLEQKDNKWIIAEGKYKVSYESLEEAALVAHLFNWFSADFKKNNPNLSLSYYDTWFFWNMFRWRGVFNENGIDTKVFTRSFISDSLKETFDSRANYWEFFRYIENTLV